MSDFSWHKLRLLAAGPRRIGLLALLAIVLTGVFMLWTARGLVRVAISSSSSPAAAAPAPDANALAAQLQSHADRVNGRSLFFVPSPPRREVAERPTDDGPPPPPSRYGGPALVAMVNDTAWFGDGTRLRMGDEPKPGAAVQLVSLQPPWSAKVQWHGVEFTVSLFERSTLLAPPKPGETASGTDIPAGSLLSPPATAAAKPRPPTPSAGGSADGPVPPPQPESPPATAEAPPSPPTPSEPPETPTPAPDPAAPSASPPVAPPAAPPTPEPSSPPSEPAGRSPTSR